MQVQQSDLRPVLQLGCAPAGGVQLLEEEQRIFKEACNSPWPAGAKTVD